MAKENLNDKQKRFCEEYIIDLNGTQAAIRAGYSPKTARSISNENLTKPDIQTYIQELKNKRCERLEISQDDVLKDIVQLKNRCMQKVPVMYYDKELKDYIQETEDGKDVWKFDSQGACKALDMLAKHVGFYETDNKQKNSVNALVDAAARIKEALND